MLFLQVATFLCLYPWNSPLKVLELRPGALGRPRGIRWSGRWEGGSGWGAHVNPWLFHFNVWQNPLQKKKKKKTNDKFIRKSPKCNTKIQIYENSWALREGERKNKTIEVEEELTKDWEGSQYLKRSLYVYYKMLKEKRLFWWKKHMKCWARLISFLPLEKSHSITEKQWRIWTVTTEKRNLD